MIKRMTKDRFKELCQGGNAYLYIVRLYNEEESFYKVGITSKRDTHERLKDYPYDYEVIQILSHPCPEVVIDLERKLISLEDRYHPTVNFPGHSECVSSKDNIESFVETLSWLKDLTPYNIETKTKKKSGTSVTRMLKEYKEIQQKISECSLAEDVKGLEEAQSSLEVFLQTNTEFNGWLDAGVTTEDMNSAGKSRERINQLVDTKRKLSEYAEAIIYDLNLKVGNVYSVKHLKETIQAYYDNVGILKTAKATDITQWFEVSKTSFMDNGKKYNALRIIKKL